MTIISFISVVLSVHNEGNPLAAEECNVIFEPHKRTESTRIGRHKSGGLGLVSAQGVAAAHGGRLRVESDAASGTTFFLNLPKEPTASAT